MKRSSQIGLAAAGVVLVATVWSMTGEETQENVVYGSVSECLAAAQLSADQCETAFAQATAARLKDAPKFRSQVECEVQYGANGCNTANVGGAQYFIPALAGFMLARGLAGAQAQPLLPPTTATCPPAARASAAMASSPATRHATTARPTAIRGPTPVAPTAGPPAAATA